jgi:hypothetical protein
MAARKKLGSMRRPTTINFDDDTFAKVQELADAPRHLNVGCDPTVDQEGIRTPHQIKEGRRAVPPFAITKRPTTARRRRTTRLMKYLSSHFNSTIVNQNYKTWLNHQVHDWRSITAITCTYRLGHQDRSGIWMPAVNEAQCRNGFRYFMNRVNRKVYGYRYRHHHKRLRVLAMVEKDSDSRWHLHGAIEPPEHLTREEFVLILHTEWHRIVGAYKIKVDPSADLGWITYMLKRRQKPFETVIDGFDLGSFYNPNA